MDNPTYVVNNGKIISTADPIFLYNNRSFRFGDGIFETIKLVDNQPHLFEKHFDRLMNGVNFLKMNISKEWTSDYFKKQIKKLAEKCEFSECARVRLTIYRGNGGYYTPLSMDAEYLLEMDAHTKKSYTLNRNGLNIDIFPAMEKSPGIYANLKTCNAHLYIMASIRKKEKKLDDCIIVNTFSRVAEAISSNIFLINNEKLYTPPLTEACIEGVMRSTVIELAEKMNIECHETPIPLEELFNADEMFLTDSIHGIRWVKKYKIKEFQVKLVKDISAELNKELMK